MSSKSSAFSKVNYQDLDGRQKEVHNYHHIAALLAKHGYATYPIRDDWNGGDMIARHMTDPEKGNMTIQIKGRLTFDRKYLNKGIWIGFPAGADAYVFPHDEFLEDYKRARSERGQPLENSKAWTEGGCVHWPRLTDELRELLQHYLLSSSGRDRLTAEVGDLEFLEPSD